MTCTGGVFASKREPQQLAKVLGALPWWASHQQFCIPIIVPEGTATNLHAVARQIAKQHGAQQEVPRVHDEDCWVIRTQDDARELVHSADHVEQRLRHITSRCKVALGRHHEDTLDSLGYLAYFLDCS